MSLDFPKTFGKSFETCKAKQFGNVHNILLGLGYAWDMIATFLEHLWDICRYISKQTFLGYSPGRVCLQIAFNITFVSTLRLQKTCV